MDPVYNLKGHLGSRQEQGTAKSASLRQYDRPVAESPATTDDCKFYELTLGI